MISWFLSCRCCCFPCRFISNAFRSSSPSPSHTCRYYGVGLSFNGGAGCGGGGGGGPPFDIGPGTGGGGGGSGCFGCGGPHGFKTAPGEVKKLDLCDPCTKSTIDCLIGYVPGVGGYYACANDASQAPGRSFWGNVCE